MSARPRRRALISAGLAALLAHLSPSAAAADPRAAGQPALTIIIDDMGNRRAEDLRALELPGAVVSAILPQTPFARSLAWLARELGKEVILHLPLEPDTGKPLGPGGLTMAMARPTFEQVLAEDLASVPFLSGVSNHMGSRMTRQPERMGWLMAALGRRGGLLFVDSRTTEATVAAASARAAGLVVAERDVFLDNVLEPGPIRARFEELVALARRRGTALGIGHPHPETLEVLEAELPRLARRGIRLVGLRELIALRDQAEPAAPLSASALDALGGMLNPPPTAMTPRP